MMAILMVFSVAFYALFRDNLYRQLQANLTTLAQVASYSFSQIKANPEAYFQQTRQLPWLGIFSPEQQGLEWFDADGSLLASQGKLKLGFTPQVGFWNLRDRQNWLAPNLIKTFTISVSVERSEANLPNLEGFVRSSQEMASLRGIERQFLSQLALSILVTLVAVSLGGMWLTKKALEPVEQSFQELKQFTGDASHELRTPLTAIKTSVDVMSKHPERFQEKDYKKLTAIARATEQMTTLTEDLLFLARTQKQGNLTQGEWQSLELHHLLADLCEWLEPLTEEKNLTLEYRYLAQAKITGDAAQLTRLFRNLLENAVFYTPAGGKISIRLIQQNQYAVISIEDTGIGIAPENLASVFQRFWREDQARTFRPGGTGLGLAIVQAVAQRHGGKVSVNSQLGVGTCFQVFLPLGSKRQRLPLFQEIAHLWQTLQGYRGREGFKKLGLVMAILLLSLLPLLLINQARQQLQIFADTRFSNGTRSFADEVVFYQKSDRPPTSPVPTESPAAILGIPQSSSLSFFSFFAEPNNYIILENGGSIVVKFKDNLLTSSGDPQADLYIFFAQETSPDIRVDISQDGYQWQHLGWVNATSPNLDLDKLKPHPYAFFSYVRLSYIGKSNEVKIDAVGAISSVLITPSSSDIIPIARGIFALLILGLIILFSLKLANLRKLEKSKHTALI
jgi:signal transduction histidine kinase